MRPFGSRSRDRLGKTYPLPPPATVYGMLLSLVGERFRRTHEGVRLALAFRRVPRIATTLRKLSRYKYGVAAKQSTLGNAPDYVETLCNVQFICWIDSSAEKHSGKGTLEERVREALSNPGSIDRYGILCLGLSDDAVDDISEINKIEGCWLRLLPDSRGNMELPVWVDHVGSAGTKWHRYTLDNEAGTSVKWSSGLVGDDCDIKHLEFRNSHPEN